MMKLFLLLVGLILILEGLPYAASPDSMREWLKKLSEMEAKHLRVAGLTAMIVGFVICFVVQKTTIFG